MAQLTALPAPTTSSETQRLNATEKQTFSVKARLVGYKQEFDPAKITEGKKPGDRDFHIVIADLQDSTKTMIVEIPDPQCSGVCASAKLSQIQQARQKFAAQFPTAPPDDRFRLVQGDVQVTFTGVGFFDFSHTQTGLAKNCIELHPVLNVEFSQPGPFTSTVATEAQEKSLSSGPYKCIPEAHGRTGPGKSPPSKKSQPSKLGR